MALLFSVLRRSPARPARCLGLAVLIAALVWLGPGTQAQTPVGSTLQPAGAGGVTWRGTDVAWDPANKVFLLVAGNGPVAGIFLNAAGQAITSPFAIMDGSAGYAHFPRVEYSPDINSGAGGFLITWHHNIGVTNYVHARALSYTSPTCFVSNTQAISDAVGRGSWWETGPAMAYSTTSDRFLVAWRTVEYGIRARFVGPSGAPIGAVIQVESESAGTRDPSLAWNPATNEFGLAYTSFSGGAFAAFRRVGAASGAVSARTSFGFGLGTFATDIGVNSASQYVVAWSVHPGTKTVAFSANGDLLSTVPTFVTDRFGHDQSLGMAFNPVSGTFLAVGSDGLSWDVAGSELNNVGVPLAAARALTSGATGGSFHPMPAARNDAAQWLVGYARRIGAPQAPAVQIVGAGSSAAPLAPPTTPATACGTPAGGGGGGTTPTPSGGGGCVGPDPFASLPGGGVCVAGGWRPAGSGGSSTPPPSNPPPSNPPPSSGGCTGPDPFASLPGGGVCVGGGWRPAGSGGGSTTTPPPPPPPPPPPSGGCTTPDPFVSIGGGTCIAGGWIPGVQCASPDPFVSLGGGICVNGGWVPKPSGGSGGSGGGGGTTPPPSSGGCTTPDPFAAIGGGKCVGGGWRPLGM